MSPIKAHAQMLSSLQSEMKNREGVHALEIRHEPHAGLSPDNMVVGRDVVCVRLLPAHHDEGSKQSMRSFFWKKVSEIGLSPSSVSLELDDREYPVWDPPV